MQAGLARYVKVFRAIGTSAMNLTKLPRGKGILFKICVSLVATTVAILLAEALMRSIKHNRLRSELALLESLVESRAAFDVEDYPGYENELERAQDFFTSMRELRLTYRPYVERRSLPDQQFGSIHINSLGYRGPEFSVTKPSGTFRLLVYGGSFAWGTGALSDDETIAGHLQVLLERRWPERKIEVLNAANTAWVSTQELVAFLTEGLLLAPDMVIFIDGYNDAWAIASGLPAGYPIHYRDFAHRLLSKAAGMRYGLEERRNLLEKEMERLKLFWRSELIESTDQILRESRGQSVARFDEAAAAHWHAASVADSVCKSRGIPCAFVIQPTPFFCKPLSEFEETALKAHGARRYGEYGWMRDHYGDYVAHTVKLFGNSDSISLFDLSCLFRGDTDSRFIDYAHLSGEGYLKVAERLYEELDQRDLLE